MPYWMTYKEIPPTVFDKSIISDTANCLNLAVIVLKCGHVLIFETHHILPSQANHNAPGLLGGSDLCHLNQCWLTFNPPENRINFFNYNTIKETLSKYAIGKISAILFKSKCVKFGVNLWFKMEGETNVCVRVMHMCLHMCMYVCTGMHAAYVRAIPSAQFDLGLLWYL